MNFLAVQGGRVGVEPGRAGWIDSKHVKKTVDDKPKALLL